MNNQKTHPLVKKRNFSYNLTITATFSFSESSKASEPLENMCYPSPPILGSSVKSQVHHLP